MYPYISHIYHLHDSIASCSEKNLRDGKDSMRRTIKDIEEILRKAKSILQKIYGKRLKSIILYGSYTRGDAVEGSDIDLIVLLEDMKNPIDKLERCSKEIHQLDFVYDIVISIIPFDLSNITQESYRLSLMRRERVFQF